MKENKFLNRLLKASEVVEGRKIILKNFQSPGDILMLTSAVRDLKISHPSISVDVRTSAPALWENNPYLTPLNENDPDVEIFDVGYPIIHESNEGAYHFIHGFRLDLESKLNIKIKQTKFCGDIHFSKEELSWVSMIHEHYTGEDTPFWLISFGGKTDYTAKWWIKEYAQQVIDYFKNKILFVQFGALGDNHYHPPLKDVINLVGKTDLRMFMRLAYHSDGIICPVTFAMHVAAALPQKPGKPKNKPCVVTAGGREPCTFTRYTHHGYLHANGYLKCCDNGGCWKSRVEPIGDNDKKDSELCVDPIDFNGRKVQRCMKEFVTPELVIQEIEKYYKGGMLKYLDSFKKEKIIHKRKILEKIEEKKKEIEQMTQETTKSNYRRIRDNRFENLFFVGKGIDIGGGDDPLDKEVFKNIKEIETFDIQNGDASYILKYKEKESYDFVYSSHCLEHIGDPYRVIKEWFDLLKEGGYMVITVPDEDMYEQGVFPSRWNQYHKHTFTIYKSKSWSDKSINIIDLINNIQNCRIIKIDFLNHYFNERKKNEDQTCGDSESAIEFVLRKEKAYHE